MTLDEFDIDLKEHVGVIDISKNNRMYVQDLNKGASLFNNEEISVREIEHKYGEYKGNTIAKKLSTSIAKIIRDENSDILKILTSS